MGKLSFLAGFGAGYVLGARAGEKRYEQIKLAAGNAWNHPAVQEQVTKATDTAKERGPEIAAAAGQAAIRGIAETAKSAATASYHAATGKNKGEVVPGQVASVDDPANPTKVGFHTESHGNANDSSVAGSDDEQIQPS